jgi:hypothetical protein
MSQTGLKFTLLYFASAQKSSPIRASVLRRRGGRVSVGDQERGGAWWRGGPRRHDGLDLDARLYCARLSRWCESDSAVIPGGREEVWAFLCFFDINKFTPEYSSDVWRRVDDFVCRRIEDNPVLRER